MVRDLDAITGTALAEIAEFTPKDRPAIIITTDTYADQFFMNWRVGRYYLPKQDFWILANDAKNKRIEHIRRDRVIESSATAPLRIPVFREGRILWLIEPNSRIHGEVAAAQTLKGGKYVFYSDITPDSPPFKIGEFEVTPTLSGALPPQAMATSHRP
jgi:hypothetical protein